MTTTTVPTTGALRPLVLLVAAGALVGVAAKAADESTWRWAADLGTYPAAWVLAVAVIARLSPSVGTAAVRAVAFFAAMTVAYYAWAELVLGFPTTWLLPAWLLLSVTAVPTTAACVRWAAGRAGVVPGLLLAGAAGIALAGGSLQRLYLGWEGGLSWDAVRPVQSVADLVTALVITVLLPLHRSTRLAALLLVLPSTWLAARALDVLHDLLG